ncbi:unnamed protein product [Microthlaspi erraticum]|uniref:Histone deacetylase interacting domain-containing protein n=1 Tax=Microthlaspi erraticum TaxID=1685480 RepID=A0A6D2J5B7_9BRAS|nr:unnamed protein product [Microthlaspi erraticum]
MITVSGQSHSMVERRVPTKQNPKQYLADLKEAFNDEPEKYEEFVQLLPHIVNPRVDIATRVEIFGRVKELLKDHQDLLLSFSDFLHPDAKRILYPEDPEAKRIMPLDDFEGLSPFQTMVSREVPQEPTIDHSLSYIAAVKEAFRDEHGKYVEFLKILKDFYANRLDRTRAIARLEEFIKEHPELLLGFNLFFPDDEPKRTSPPEPSRTNLYEAKRTVPPEARDHHCVESSCTKRKHAETDGESFMDKLKTRFRTLDTHVVESFIEIMEKFEEGEISKREVCDEVVDLLYYHEDLIEDFPKYFKRRKTYRNSTNISY